METNQLTEISNLSIPQLKDLEDYNEPPPKSPTIASTSVMSEKGDVMNHTPSEFAGSATDHDPLPTTSPFLLSSSKPPRLEPSPSFDSKIAPTSVESELEECDSRSQKRNEPMLCSETGSVKSSCSGVKKTLISNQDHSIPSRTCSTTPNLSTPPTIKNRMLSYFRTTPKPLTPKPKFFTSSGRPSASRPETLDLKYSSRKNVAIKKSDSSPSLSPSIAVSIPPMSLPNYLQLELSSSGPSSLYINGSSANQSSFESSSIKFQRLLNFMILPPELEKILLFGTFACLDAWLHTFTILPLRCFRAIGLFSHWWGQVIMREISYISGFIYHGSGRMWNRQCQRSISLSRPRTDTRSFRSNLSDQPSNIHHISQDTEISDQGKLMENRKNVNDNRSRRRRGRKHYAKLRPTSLSSREKADLIQGTVIILSCIILLKLDASRMYHYIRGQAAIKLYVIFNVLEVS